MGGTFRVAGYADGENFLRSVEVVFQIHRGGAHAMEKLDKWICPVCNNELILTEYPSKRGFKLKCKGSDGIPHEMRIYLSGFRKDAPFLPVPIQFPAPESAPEKSRAKQLLERARLAAAA